MKRLIACVLALAVLLGAAACGGATAQTSHAAAPSITRAPASAALPPIRHVFVIVLENESAATTFGPDSPAPYLARTLVGQGAFLPHYYGVGHDSNDNYIAMISGQPPNAENQADCQDFDNFPADATGPYGAEEGVGCVYPAGIQNIGTELDTAGLTWRDYDEDMGSTPSREAAQCGHPSVGQMDNTQKATAQDMYATRHNPFVYFHSVIDDTSLCDSHVVNLDLLPHDLASASSTPNYTFVVPDLCDDGHDSPCADGEPGGLTSANAFLKKWVPMITHSPAFTEQNGLLIITFDEAATSDTSSCCGEIPGPGSPEPGIEGPGGGDVGAVLLSPCIAPRTVSENDYNHYTMLRTVEDVFGLPHLGYAQLPGESDFGSDVFTRRCNSAPNVGFRLARVLKSRKSRPRLRIRWSSSTQGATFEVQVQVGGHQHGPWKTLLDNTTKRSLVYTVHRNQTYSFRIRSRNGIGLVSQWRVHTIRVTR